MNYNLNNLDPASFEYLAQALSKCMLGDGTTTFGAGPDGGREATFDGRANYPSAIEQWDGYWVIQAKFRNVQTEAAAKSFSWLKDQVLKEIKKYENRKIKIKIPDNLVFFTNINLTATVKNGGRDRANDLISQLKKSHKIKNIAIIAYDDIVTFLNIYRSVAVSFSGFILPGDILSKLYLLLDKASDDCLKLNNYLSTYLELEFKNNMLAKLEHAGKLTSEKINLEKVFIDLYATSDGIISDDKPDKFVTHVIRTANQILKPSLEKESRYVLIAGPGYGKSTLTQYLCQLYRAFFLAKVDKADNVMSEVQEFITHCSSSIKALPTCFRFPIRMTLKDYAAWITAMKIKEQPFSVIEYIKSSINRRCNDNYLTSNHVLELLASYPTLIVFDGLDEVPSSSNRQEVLNEIDAFTEVILRRSNSDSIIIGTSRPQGYAKDFHSVTYKHLSITDLPAEDCLQYISKLLETLEDDRDKIKNDFQILEKANVDPIVGRLMKSPLQASIMTILVRSGGEPPRNKYELFTEYYTTIFRREKQKNVLRILNDYPEYINNIHYRLGYALQYYSQFADNPSAIMPITSFQLLIEKYLLNEIGLNPEEAIRVNKDIIEAVTNRLVFIEEVQEDFIGFNIRSIQEFFAANYLMRNQPDSIIHERLNAIATSSYWNNTLLFSIGYLFSHKQYTLDYLDSLCYRLNGSDQAYREISLTSLYKHGSWIAKDVLNEGIFRGHRKYENTFSSLLTDIFRIPFITEHRSILNLPDNIKNDWVLNIIKENKFAKNTHERYTACVINILAEKFDRLEWNLTSDELIFIVMSLDKLGLINRYLVFQVMFPEIHQHPYFTFKSILSLSSVKEVVGQSILEVDDDRIKSELLDTIFSSCYFFISTETDGKILEYLLDAEATDHFNAEIGSGLQSFFKNEDYFRFSIVGEHYGGGIAGIFQANTASLDWLDEKVCHFQTSVLKQLVLFYRAPGIESLHDFVSVSLTFCKEDLQLRNYFGSLNWLFRIIYNPKSSDNEILNKIKEGYFGDENKWSGIENKLRNEISEFNLNDLLKYSAMKSMSNINLTLVNDFITTYNHVDDVNSNIAREAVRLFYWVITDNYNKKAELNEGFDDYLFRCYDICFSKPHTDYLKIENTIFPLVAVASSKSILNNLDTFESLILKMSIHQDRQSLRNEQIRGPLIDSFSKIARLYPIICSVSENTNVLKFLTSILVSPDVPFSLLLMKDLKLNDEDLKTSKTEDQTFYSICLMLFF